MNHAEILKIMDVDLELPFDLGNMKNYKNLITLECITYDYMDNKIVLNYLPNKINQNKLKEFSNARGMIFNLEKLKKKDDFIEAFPFNKFVSMHDLNPEDIDEVTIKYDGVLVLSYWNNDQLKWSTRKYFDSKIARAANHHWKLNYGRIENKIPKNLTVYCEYIHPELTRILIPYKQEFMILLSAIDKNSGKEISRKELEDLSRILNIKTANPLSISIETVLKDVYKFTNQQEGYILKMKDGNKIKISSPIYNAVYDLLTEPSPWMISEIWLDWEEYDEIISFLPEKIKNEIYLEFIKLDNLKLKLDYSKESIAELYRKSVLNSRVKLFDYLEDDL
ncbi:hypothetical protein [Paenibacillus campi]|uniref:hypothetical protein n=1 Tax=Paenibacillus campi TaxID=3106031 RepID=UPI002B003D22|nr:hypothetical protein [Paenibacillus sp. SGZ-1014]